MDIIVGTAGHIDHGKTALVKALTGIDADRLPEEKKRGITIDLGFAELDLGDVRIGFVDVPGHERFVKNMLAGAHGIDLVALVVAADEGVMPQTREHFAICRLLETKAGIIVVTKKDLVDDELLELVKLDIQELTKGSFLEGAGIFTVSAKSGEGIEELKSTIKNAALKIPQRRSDTIARLPIDRSFTMKGFGAVITGTLVAGEINEGDEMELLPVGKKVRVRGLQTHGKSVTTAHAGQRTAVNLGGIDHSEVERGQIIAPLGKLNPTQIFDAEVEMLSEALKPLKSRQRVRVHIGTVEALARVHVIGDSNEINQGQKGFAQIRLESPVVVLPGDKFIIRSYSPQMTIAGGTMLDTNVPKYRRKDFKESSSRLYKLLEAINKYDKLTQLRVNLESSGERGATFAFLQAKNGWLDNILNENIKKLLEQKAAIDAEGVYVSRSHFDELAKKAKQAIEAHHKAEPLSRGMMRETLREKVFANLPQEIFRRVLKTLGDQGEIEIEKDIVRIAAQTQKLSEADKTILEKLKTQYENAKLEVPNLDAALLNSVTGTKIPIAQARKVFQLLIDSGEIVKVTDEFYFKKDVIDDLINKLKSKAGDLPDRLIDVPAFKDMAGVSRKYAIPLLEYFDREKITRRAGDKRLIL